jgi:hypothetical protein
VAATIYHEEPAMYEWILAALLVIAAGIVTVGVALIYVPAAVIFAGVALAVLSVVVIGELT